MLKFNKKTTDRYNSSHINLRSKRFFEALFWLISTKKGIRFFNNGYHFDYDTYRMLTESALKQLERYNTFQEAIKIKSFLFCNFLSTVIENQDWKSLKKYRADFFDVTKDTGEGSQQRTFCVLTYHLYDYVMTKEQNFLKNAKKIEEMCYLLGNDYHRMIPLNFLRILYLNN